MKWTSSRVEPVSMICAAQIKRIIEIACRNCYKSEDKISEDSADRLIRSCIARGHESPLEHASITYRIICDRAVLAEWTRHRMASYCVESQRYCNYSKDKFDNNITCVLPTWAEPIASIPLTATTLYADLTSEQRELFSRFKVLNAACVEAETKYFDLLNRGMRPEDARAVLPNCTKTDIVCTMNLRELRHFVKLRGSAAAHPDIRKLANELLAMLRHHGLGVFFEDIGDGDQE